MKTKYYAFLLTACALSILGCQDLNEDPKASLTPNSYFNTQEDLDASVTAIYASFTIDHGIGGTTYICNAFGSDDLGEHPASNKGEMRQFDQLNGNSNNFRIERNWTINWSGIYQANNVIANYGKVNSTDDLKNGSAAQAYFLRAFAYFRLVKEFGPLPLIIEPTDVDARPPRADEKTIYNQIVADLKTAIDLFPPSFPAASNRANLLAAKALLADVYLNMTGWPLNEANNYSLAAEVAEDVIQSGKFNLVPDYATVFTTDGSSESVFAIKFDLGGGFGASISRFFGSFAMPEQEQGLSGNSGWNDYCTEINFYKNAPKCKRSWQTFYDTLKIKNEDNTFSKVPWNSPLTSTQRPYFKKFRFGVGVPGSGDGCEETSNGIVNSGPSSGKDMDVIRYPMILLDYAEASAMSNGAPTSASYSAVNLVRRRAGLPDLTPGLSATAFRDSVVQERAYEFAGELGIRWMDIQRLQLLPKIISERSPLENPIPTGIAADPSNRYLAPIPQDEIYRNPTWTQNAGY